MTLGFPGTTSSEHTTGSVCMSPPLARFLHSGAFCRLRSGFGCNFHVFKIASHARNQSSVPFELVCCNSKVLQTNISLYPPVSISYSSALKDTGEHALPPCDIYHTKNRLTANSAKIAVELAHRVCFPASFTGSPTAPVLQIWLSLWRPFIPVSPRTRVLVNIDSGALLTEHTVVYAHGVSKTRRSFSFYQAPPACHQAL